MQKLLYFSFAIGLVTFSFFLLLHVPQRRAKPPDPLEEYQKVTVTSEEPDEETITYGTSIASDVRVRSRPSIQGSVVGTLSLGERVQLIKQDDQWIKDGWVLVVKEECKTTGYVYAGLVHTEFHEPLLFGNRKVYAIVEEDRAEVWLPNGEILNNIDASLLRPIVGEVEL